jgi:hypothetical protein
MFVDLSVKLLLSSFNFNKNWNVLTNFDTPKYKMLRKSIQAVPEFLHANDWSGWIKLISTFFFAVFSC